MRAVVLPLVLAPVLALATPVSAAPGSLATIGPSATAWYDQTYPTTTPAPPPLPPGVSADDLYVAGLTVPVGGLPLVPVPPAVGDRIGTLRGVAALAAMSFTVPEGRTPASLTLSLTGALSAATVGARAPTGVTLEACPTTTAFLAGGHQAYDLAPGYDCSGRTSLSSLSADGRSVMFSDIGRVARGRVLSFVVLPRTTGVDRLVLAPPTREALSLLDFDAAPVFSPTGAVALPAVPPGPVAAPVARPALSQVPSPVDPAPVLVAAPTVSGSSPAPVAVRAAATATTDDTRVRALALAGLALLLAGAAFAAGTDRRRASADQEWGFGRYRAVRQGRAPTL